MGASISYRPINPAETTCFASGSTLHSHLVLAFGDFPVKVSKSDIKTIEGMAYCGYPDLHSLVNAIVEYGCVELTVEY